MNAELGQELGAIWEWLDKERALIVGIITGAGRAFCAGADLKGEEYNQKTIMKREWKLIYIASKNGTTPTKPRPRA